MSFFSGKRVLVTGAAGFLGSNLVRGLLEKGASVHALVRPSSDLWRLEELRTRLSLSFADVARREELSRAVQSAAPEILFHLAARGVVERDAPGVEILETNVLGTFHLLEATRPLACERFVHVGSSTECGRKNEPIKESDCLEPSTLRGASKAAATLLCQQVARAENRSLVILRPFSVYGPWEAPGRLVPTAIRAALDGLEMPLTAAVFRRDLVFVEDVVEACLMAAERDLPAGEIVNIATGREWSNEEVVRIVESVSGRPIRRRVGEYPARENDNEHWVADIAKAGRLLGWTPRHTLAAGLEKTIAWCSRVRAELVLS